MPQRYELSVTYQFFDGKKQQLLHTAAEGMTAVCGRSTSALFRTVSLSSLDGDGMLVVRLQVSL